MRNTLRETTTGTFAWAIPITIWIDHRPEKVGVHQPSGNAFAGNHQADLASGDHTYADAQ